MSIIELIVSLAAILGAAVLFTNAVELLGDRLGLQADRERGNLRSGAAYA